MAAVLAGLKSVDFYRKLKRDLQQELTEVRAVCLHALSGSRTFGVVCVCVCLPCAWTFTTARRPPSRAPFFRDVPRFS